MTKYNVGDVLEISEDFKLEYAVFSDGEKYSVVGVGERFYSLESDKCDYTNTISEVDAHSGFRKVEPKVVFKVGDKVRLLEGAHSSPGYSTDNSEKVKSRLSTWGLGYQSGFTVAKVKDWEGDVYVSNEVISLYIMSEFLVPWVEEEEKPAEHMELGKTYQSTSNDFFYTPTEFDFESERVAFDFRSEGDSFVSTSHRYFYTIEGEFGVLPPVKPETQVEPKFKVGQVWRNSHDRELSITEVDGSHITYAYTGNESPFYRRAENTEGWTLVTQEVNLATIAEAVQEELIKAVGVVEPDNSLAVAVGRMEPINSMEEFVETVKHPETVSVVALREAWDYVDQTYPDLEKLIELAKRLS